MRLSQIRFQKKIKKIRGGAQVIDSGSTSNFYLSGNAFLIDKEKNADIKRAIAKTACELCNDGESIIINGGSSTYMMADFLRDKRLNILTNSFVLAQDLVENSQNQVTLPGGEVYRKQSIILSSFENDTTQNYRGTMMFMGTPGISKYGVMESDPLLILAEKKLRKQADKPVVLADSTKIGLQSNLVFCDLESVDIVITDNRADKAQLDEIRSYGIEVIVVDVETLEAA